MELNDYQDEATKTVIYPGRGEITGLTYAALGLGNEAGEVQGKVKKIIRDHQGVMTNDLARPIARELGDVLWYLAMVADEIGFSLREIAKMNLDNLASRQQRGVLGGSGDNR